MRFVGTFTESDGLRVLTLNSLEYSQAFLGFVYLGMGRLIS